MIGSGVTGRGVACDAVGAGGADAAADGVADAVANAVVDAVADGVTDAVAGGAAVAVTRTTGATGDADGAGVDVTGVRLGR